MKAFIYFPPLVPKGLLFEFDGVRRDSAPSRETGKAVAALTANGVGTCGADDNQAQAGHLVAFGGGNTSGSIDVGTCLTTSGQRLDFDTETFAMAFSCKDYGADASVEIAPTMRAMGHSNSHANAGGQLAAAYSVALRGREGGATAELGDEVAGCLRASSGGGDKPHVLSQVADTLTSSWHQSNGATGGNNPGVINPVLHGLAVRRLMPMECERLQAFPDGYTDIPKAADGPRYKSLGNSMCVNVMAWIGRRIELVAGL